MQNIKHKILGIISILSGMTGIFVVQNISVKIFNVIEKQDTLTFLLQDEKNEQNVLNEKKGLLASFITPEINKYSGPVTESMLTCIDGYDTTKIQNIYKLEQLQLGDGSVSVKIPESSAVVQNRSQIKREIMPVFGHAVKNQEINWTWDNEKRVYTFETYVGDEALWYCYLRKETIFFTNFFKITEQEQADPLPPISNYRLESYGNRIMLDWDYDYSQLKNLLKNDMIEFRLEYKKANQGDFAWVTSKKIGYPRVIFEEKKDENYYWGEPFEYGEIYDVRLSVKSMVHWYKDSEPLIFQIETDELTYGYDISDVAKVNEKIDVTVYAKTVFDENDEIEYEFHPALEETNGKAFVNIYNKNNIKQYVKNINITEEDYIYTDRLGNIKNAYKIKKNIKIDIPGVYTAKMCFGETAESCVEYGLSSEIEVLDFTCNEVFEGHNIANADRINIVFIGSRYRKFADFLAAVRESLTWDGKPVLLSRFNEKEQRDKNYDLDWGFFAIEPFKSNKNKFNIWYVNEPMTTLTNSIENICGFDYEYDAIYANRSFLGMTGQTRSFASKAAFGENRSKGTSDGMFTYSHNYMPYDEFGTHTLNYELFAHETGHAVFGLDDEYDEGGNSHPQYGEVSCMRNEVEAEKKWGDLLGKVDPFWNEVKADMIKYNLNTYEITECKRTNQNEQESEMNKCLLDENNQKIFIDIEKEKYPKSYFITQYFRGGCNADYGDERVIKPTEHSLMSYNIPILGSVNRREVERVLEMFTGE